MFRFLICVQLLWLVAYTCLFSRNIYPLILWKQFDYLSVGTKSSNLKTVFFEGPPPQPSKIRLSSVRSQLITPAFQHYRMLNFNFTLYLVWLLSQSKTSILQYKGYSSDKSNFLITKVVNMEARKLDLKW